MSESAPGSYEETIFGEAGTRIEKVDFDDQENRRASVLKSSITTE